MVHEPSNPITDKSVVRDNLYADPAKLGARVELHARYSTSTQPVPDWELSLTDLDGVQSALDVGCGNGNFLIPLARRLTSQKARVVGLDLSDGMVEAVGERLAAEGLSCELRVGDVENLPFDAGTFDLILANFMLYHVPHLDRAIRELRRVLRPGGTLLAATNGLRHMRDLWELGAAAARDVGVPEPVIASLLGRDSALSRLSFSLENGMGSLSRHFADVRMERYPDELRVTDAEPLVRYFASMWTVDMVAQATAAPEDEQRALTQNIIAKVRERAAAHIAANGFIRIAKDSGAFVAR
jgi:SAM-dependent methyltransferase